MELNFRKIFTFFFIFFSIYFLFQQKEVRATTYEVTMENGVTKEINVNLEDFIHFISKDKTYQYTFFCNENGKQLFHFGNGKYWVSAAGRATVIISGRDKQGRDSFIADYRIIISDKKTAPVILNEEVPEVDENKVGQSESKEKTQESTLSNEKWAVNMNEVSVNVTDLIDKRVVIKSRDKRISHFTIDVNSPVSLVQNQNVELSFQNTNSSLTYSISLKHKLYVEVKGVGKDVLTVTMNGKDYIFNVSIEEKGLNETTVVLAVGDTYNLHLNGFEGTSILWDSDNKEAVKISKKGKITALKEGNSVITAKVNEEVFAAVISVTTQLKKDVVNYTKNYSSAGKYSQPKRMLEGFYDCSSLVWRAYKKYGHIILIDYYAPVAAAMGKYYMEQNKVIEGGVTGENIEKRVFEPGDLLFVEGKINNRRYRNIDHVEMIYGYSIEGIDAEGKAILGIRYANNHQSGFKGFVGRPNTEKNELGVYSY